MKPTDVTHFDGPAAFRAWLEKHHDSCDALWVGFWKKATGRPSMTWEESVDEALCFGWIDGIRRSIDEEAYTIRFTPRRARSTWSLRNMERYAALEAEGRLRSPGVAAFERRTEENTGRYSFEQEKPEGLSADLVDRLRAHPDAWADWNARPPSYRKRATHWIMTAKREETRERRFEALLADCAAGRKVKPLRP